MRPNHSTPRGIAHARTSALACAALIAWTVPGSFVVAAGSPPDVELPASVESSSEPSSSPQDRGRFRRGDRGVYKSRITPHWFEDGACFWYRNDLRGGAREFVFVDAEAGTRRLAFDHARLAAALSSASDRSYAPERLPFDEIELIDRARSVRFGVDGKSWSCDLESYECTPASEARRRDDEPAPRPSDDEGARRFRRGRDGAGRLGPRGERGAAVRSPDDKWEAFVDDHDVFVRALGESASSEEGERSGERIALSDDGDEANAYGRLEWSPDSRVVVAWRIEPGERKEVHLVRSSPRDGGRAEVESRPYALPGDRFTRYELDCFDVAARDRSRPVADRFEHGWSAPEIHWSRDGKRFSYLQVDRGHQRLRVIEVDPLAGTTRNLIDETSETFIWTVHTENLRLRLVDWLEESDELIYVSERDGWRHLYLVDPRDASLRQITRGEWVVRGIERIDEEKRRIWFSASGRNAGQDPYFVHHYRIDFDGSGLVALTAGDGDHRIEFSPDRRFVIDAYSRADLPPVHELRRVSDGSLVSKLEEADISELDAEGWKPPEVFVATGRDGRTDIWGLIFRPRNFDPAKKYPVIEDIYAGPQGSFVPKSFAVSRYRALTDLGFIVVKIDGMGTANRSKAFHDVCWHDLKDAGFADRILWIAAAAAKYPQIDITRVGVYGNSAGGQNAAAAVLFHPEFYKVAVASCGCHDNRMDKASWNEQWMGYPVGPQYAECSNIENAHRLRGKLFLIVGEADTNVPPESTMRFVDALVRAGKDFDLLVVPNGGHGMGGEYGQRRMQDFFLRHLAGVEPPDRNAGPTRTD